MLSFLSKPTTSIAVAGWILSASAFISALLGLVRTRLLFNEYGVGVETDIYNIAFSIPDFIYILIIGGALSATFIPVFISRWQKDQKDAWRLADSFLKIASLTVIILAVILAVLMPVIIKLLYSDFSVSDQQAAVILSRIMLLSPILLGISAVFSNILQSMSRFVVYAFCPLFYNIGIIVGIVIFTNWWGIYGLAIGVVFGAFLHLIIQVPLVLKSGFSLSRELSVHPAIYRVLKLMAPRSFALGIYQFNIIAISAIASTISSGAITIFVEAHRIDMLLTGVFGVSFATAMFPSLSDSYARKDYKKYLASFSKVLRNVFFITFPMGLLLFILRFHIIQVIYGAEKVSQSEVQLMAAVLGLLSFSAFAYALVPIIIRAFYAKENTRTPVISSVVNVAVTIALSSILLFVVFPNTQFLSFIEKILNLEGVQSTEVIALPLAVAIAGVVALAVSFLSFIIDDARNKVILKEEWLAIVRIGYASIATGIVAWGALRFLNTSLNYNQPVSVLILEAVAVLSVALVTYIAIVYSMRFPEREVIDFLLKNKKYKNPNV